MVIGVFDQDVDFGQSEFDGEAHAPVAVGDGEIAVSFGHGRRLDDADDLDAGLHGRVGHFAGLDFARVAGVLLQCAGIDASQFHLNSPDFGSSRTSSKMKPRRARAIRPGQRRRVAPGSGPPSEAAERTHPLRRGAPVLRSRLSFVPHLSAAFCLTLAHLRHEGESRLSRSSITDSVGYVGWPTGSRRKRDRLAAVGEEGGRTYADHGHRSGVAAAPCNSCRRAEQASSSSRLRVAVGLERREDVYDLRGARRV